MMFSYLFGIMKYKEVTPEFNPRDDIIILFLSMKFALNQYTTRIPNCMLYNSNNFVLLTSFKFLFGELGH